MAKAGDGLRRLATRAERMGRQWPGDAADLVKAELERELRADTGDGRLSHGRDLGTARVVVRDRVGEAIVEAEGKRVWGVLEKAGRRPRRTWSRGVKAADPKVKRSADQAWREVMG